MAKTRNEEVKSIVDTDPREKRELGRVENVVGGESVGEAGG